MTSDLRMPLVLDVLVGGRARDGEADDEDVSLWVGQRPEPVILLLTGGVPQVQTDSPVVHCHLNAPHPLCVYVCWVTEFEYMNQ